MTQLTDYSQLQAVCLLLRLTALLPFIVTGASSVNPISFKTSRIRGSLLTDRRAASHEVERLSVAPKILSMRALKSRHALNP